jgi:hypothetical protein
MADKLMREAIVSNVKFFRRNPKPPEMQFNQQGWASSAITMTYQTVMATNNAHNMNNPIRVPMGTSNTNLHINNAHDPNWISPHERARRRKIQVNPR